MSELTLLLLRFGFLLLLWAFVFAVVYALRSDLFGQRVRRMPSESQAAAPFPSAPAAPPSLCISTTVGTVPHTLVR